MKTVKQIVKEYLENQSYDGLFVPGECACTLDNLMTCEVDEQEPNSEGELCDLDISECRAGHILASPPQYGRCGDLLIGAALNELKDEDKKI